MDILRDHSTAYIPPAILFCFLMLLVVAVVAIGASVWSSVLYMSAVDFLHQCEGIIAGDLLDNEMGNKSGVTENSAQVPPIIYVQE